jgi:hypothetical protein
MNQDLLRQRRNLIAISAFLVLFDIANVQVAKVSLLGNELIIGNVQLLIYSAWCLWAYFLLRYYQYWRAEPAQYIRDSFATYLDSLARAYTKAQAMRDEFGGFSNDYKIVRTGLLRWSYAIQVFNSEKLSVEEKTASSFSVWRLLYWQFKSVLFVALQTPHATDRVFPFMVAITAPIVVLTKKCPPPWPWLWDLSQSHICK